MNSTVKMTVASGGSRIFTASCSICGTKHEANNAASVATWLDRHEQEGTSEHRLHQIDSWLSFYQNFIPKNLTADKRLEEYERILNGALSGEDAPVVMA